MGLAETLGARAARKGRSAPVECGELGVLTVEALPVWELELLLRGPDGWRAVFYAACRELQSAGEELRKAGKVFTPDGIMQFVSDSEAEAAAEVILALSGETKAYDAKTKREQAGTKQEPVRTKADTGRTKREFRLAPVQLEEGVKAVAVPAAQDENSPASDDPAETEKKKGSPPSAETKQEQTETKADAPSTKREQVRTKPHLTNERQFRLLSVQKKDTAIPNIGQDSRETETENGEFVLPTKVEKKAQALGIFSPERTQNVGAAGTETSDGDQYGGAAGEGLHGTESEFREVLHETTSEIRGKTPGPLHETTSEIRLQTPRVLHEITSEFQQESRETLSTPAREIGVALHETESDFDETSRTGLHEIKSEFTEKAPAAVHEIKSELRNTEQGTPHEMTTEVDEVVHETTSELAEDVARRLVEGLRRAKWVRGD